MSPFRSIALLGVTLLCPLLAQGGSRTLDTPIRFRSSAGRPMAGDFNRDGKQDLLVLTQSGASFSPGGGDGTFGKAIVTGAGAGGPMMGLADFNRDGNADLYGANSSTPFAVIPGRGDGTFTGPAYTPASGPRATLIAAGDFNGDTFPDLACAFQDTGEVIVHFGDGAGAFTTGPTTPMTVEGTLTALKAADFDGDGRDDLFLLTDKESLLGWNGGTGTFFQQSRHRANGRDAATGDVNGDALPDIVTLSGDEYEHASGWAEVLFGAATRAVGSAARFPSRLSAPGLVLAQMDGAGGLDIVLGTRDVTVITHDGTNFRAPHSFAAAPAAGSVAAADFDGDGKTDVLSLHYDTPSSLFAFIHGNGDGTLRADLSFHDLLGAGTATTSNVAAVTDVNGDGILDLVIVNAVPISNWDVPANLAVAFGNGTGFAAPIVSVSPQGFQYQTPAAGDINGDGRVDLLFQGTDSSTNTARWQPFVLQQDGTFVAGPVTSGTTAPVKLVADLTADGRLDVLDTAGQRYAGNANGTFGPGVATGVTMNTFLDAVDLNNDGRLDIVTWGGMAPGSFHYELLAYLSNSDGTFSAPRATVNISNVTGFADVDGDGFPELFSFNHLMYRANGDGTFSNQFFLLTTLDVYLKNKTWAADFDGDGKTDVAIPGAIFYGTGQAAFDGAARTAAVAEIISTADFDGNGSPDLWTVDPAGHRIVIVRTRRGAAGAVPPALTADLGGDPTSYGDSVHARIGVAADAAAEARGAVLVQVDSRVASLYLPATDGTVNTNVVIPIGTSSVHVTFTGDSYYGPAGVSLTHTVIKAVPFVGLSVTPALLEKGGSVKICATVGPYNSAQQPTGTVTIRKDGAVIGTVTASAQCNEPLNLTNVAAGVYTLAVEYPGDDQYGSRTATKTLTVTRYNTAMVLTLPANAFEGQQTSITAAFPEDPDITGTVTFTHGGRTFDVPIANGKAVLTTTFPWGTGTMTANYGGSTDFEPASSSAPLQVYRSGMSAGPALFVASVAFGSAFDITLTISPVYGAKQYVVYRSVDGGPLEVWLLVGASASSASTANDYSQYSHSFAYAAVARDQNGNPSPMGPRVVTSTFFFTDPTLATGQTKAKALHVAELQTAINGYRQAAGLPQSTFTPLAAGGAIAAVPLTELRAALGEARSVLGRPISFTDPTLTPGVTLVRAIHFRELRDALR